MLDDRFAYKLGIYGLMINNKKYFFLITISQPKKLKYNQIFLSKIMIYEIDNSIVTR